jgi:hypothetical protein
VTIRFGVGSASAANTAARRWLSLRNQTLPRSVSLRGWSTSWWGLDMMSRCSPAAIR